MRSLEANCLATMADWFRGAIPDAWRRWREQREFAAFANDDPVEARRVAREVGLTTNELRQISGSGWQWRRLLAGRMRRLGLDFAALNAVDPAITRDLALSCARCSSKLRCACDLAAGSHTDTWRSYCVNRDTFDALLDRRHSG